MEDSTTLPSIWTSINNWCTPTILFLFLNLMIATILFTSNLPNNNTNTNNQNKQQNQKTQTQNESNKLARSQSILNRLRSFNLHPYRSQNDQQHPLQQEVQEEQDALELAATQYVFDHPFPDQQDLQPQPIPVSPKPDLDPKTKKVQPQSEPVFKAQTHFIYDRHTIEKITTHYDFGPTHIENKPEKTTHLDFDPTHLEKPQEKQTHYDFDLTHLEKRQEKPTHYDFDPTHIEKPQEKPTHYDFDPTHLEKPQEKPTHYDFDPTHVKTEPKNPTHEEEENDTLDEVYSNITGGQVNRTKSDTQPASGEVPLKLPAKMKKSASMKSPFSHFEGEKIVEARRPETVREQRKAADDDVEVDAKADDFINKFKHQLRLQRLDSIIRYKDMVVNRGGQK